MINFWNGIKMSKLKEYLGEAQEARKYMDRWHKAQSGIETEIQKMGNAFFSGPWDKDKEKILKNLEKFLKTLQKMKVKSKFHPAD